MYKRQTYCKENGDELLSRAAFASALKVRGVTAGPKVQGRRTWRGIWVRTPAEYREAEATGSLQENL